MTNKNPPVAPYVGRRYVDEEGTVVIPFYIENNLVRSSIEGGSQEVTKTVAEFAAAYKEAKVK